MENKTVLKIHDMVFAKIKGYPHWPGTVTHIETTPDNKRNKYHIAFFGTSETAIVKYDDLCLYMENIQKYGQKKTDNFKNKKFNKAIDEAALFFTHYTKPDCNENCNEEENNTEQLGNTSFNLSFGSSSRNEEIFTNEEDIFANDFEVSERLIQLTENLKQARFEKELADNSLQKLAEDAEDTYAQLKTDIEKKEREILKLTTIIDKKNIEIKQLKRSTEKDCQSIAIQCEPVDIYRDKNKDTFIGNYNHYKQEVILLKEKIEQLETELKYFKNNENENKISFENMKKMYPKDNYYILSQRLHTNVELHKQENKSLQVENQTMRDEISNLRAIIEVLQGDRVEESINVNSINSYPPLQQIKENNTDWQIPCYPTRRKSNKENQIVTTCSNRFKLLQDTNDNCEFPAETSHPSPINKTNLTRKNRNCTIKRPLQKHKYERNIKNNILLLTDSHGRKCGQLIKDSVGNNFHVTSIIKPNAKFCEVIKDMTNLTSHFTENDFVVVLGGTNTFLDNKTTERDFDITAFEEVARNTNIIFAGIPLRYDRTDLNRNIMQTNEIINKKLENIRRKNRNIIGLNKIKITRKDHTKHGLHLNYTGKQKLCVHISAAIHNELRKRTMETKELSACNRQETSTPVTTIPQCSPINCEVQYNLQVGALDQSADIMVHHPVAQLPDSPTTSRTTLRKKISQRQFNNSFLDKILECPIEID